MLNRIYLEDEKKKKSIPILSRAIFIFTGIVLGFVLFRLFFISFTINDSTMLPNLKKGDWALIIKVLSPVVGDIVLIQSPVEPEKVLLRRLIAKDGDVIEIKNKAVYKNFQIMEFNWPVHRIDARIFPMNFSHRDNLPEKKIKEGGYFVLTDNLDLSFDSRDFGEVREENIIGKVIFKY